MEEREKNVRASAQSINLGLELATVRSKNSSAMSSQRTLTVGILFTFYVTLAGCSTPFNNRRVATISMINRTYVGIVIVEDQRKKPAADLIEADEFLHRIGFNRSLAILFEQADIVIGSKATSLSSLELLDAYGRPLICLTRNEALKQKLPEDLIGKSRSLAIYSAGPNGVDEHGLGDDIYWAEP
jgi:hypothetical protein